MIEPIIFVDDPRFAELFRICRGCPNYTLKERNVGSRKTEQFPTEMQPYCIRQRQPDAWNDGLHLEWVAGMLWDEKKGTWKDKEICTLRNAVEDA